MAKEWSKSFYNSKEWNNVRNMVLLRDRGLCRRCGQPASDVHHIKHLTAENINNPNVALNPKNLECLCKTCHTIEHDTDRNEEYMFDSNGFLVRKQ